VSGTRRRDGVILILAIVGNCGNLNIAAKGASQGQTPEALSTDVMFRGGFSYSSDEVSVMEMERRGGVIQPIYLSTDH